MVGGLRRGVGVVGIGMGFLRIIRGEFFLLGAVAV